MLTYLESLGIVALSVATAFGALFILHRRLEANARKRANGVNGWQLSILGTIYAVSLGFMLSDAWLAYQHASEDVRSEASAVRTIANTARLMPSTCSKALRAEVRDYLKAVVENEWPAMQRHHLDASGQSVVGRMWSSLELCNTQDSIAIHESMIDALSTLQSRRDARMLDFNGHLPAIMWGVLLFGGASVIGASCLLSNERQWVHCVHVMCLTILISLTLLAIADLDRPFDGATRVESTSFRAVQETVFE